MIQQEPTEKTDKNHDLVIIRAAFNILDKWQCTPEQQQNILQISKAAFYKYRSETGSISLSKDQKERISYLLNMHAALRIVFDNPANVYGFMRMANHNPYFNGETPLNLISSGHFGTLYEVAKRIDALRGGMQA